MKFTWIGGPSFVLELGPFRIVGDPVHHREAKASALVPAAPFDAAGIDVALVTSALDDHCDPDALARCNAGTVLVPAHLKDASIRDAKPLAHGDSLRLEKEGAALTIAAVPAGREGNGYFLRLDSGARPFTAYVTGDTLFSEDTREIQRAHGYANLLVLHVGAERAPDGKLRSADAKEAMQIIYRMQPNAIAAVHHGTFSHYTETLAPLIEKIGLTIYDKRLRVLREGESFEKVIGPAE
jgi:L-ascorbate metabolism protein UlaG (beta-lactamase superfamily)